MGLVFVCSSEDIAQSRLYVQRRIAFILNVISETMNIFA